MATRPPASSLSRPRAAARNSTARGYEYIRNDFFNAFQYGDSRTRMTKSPDKENDYGANIGGPIWLPQMHGDQLVLEGLLLLQLGRLPGPRRREFGDAFDRLSQCEHRQLQRHRQLSSTTRTIQPSMVRMPGQPINYGGNMNQINPPIRIRSRKAWMAALPDTHQPRRDQQLLYSEVRAGFADQQRECVLLAR